MNIKATASFQAGNWSRLEAKLVPLLTEGVGNAATAVLDISRQLVPVDTGELVSSGMTSVAWQGSSVNGFISYSAGHAAFVEFGTGIRGAASAGAGPYPYSETWPGMVAQPYIRPALDLGRQEVLDAIKAALGV